MADFTNRQLAEIISNTAIHLKKSADKTGNSVHQLEKKLKELDEKIALIEKIDLKPDLRELNSFYELKVEGIVKRVNLRLNVPHIGFYVWGTALVMILISATFIYYSVQSKQEIITEYHKELTKEKEIISKEEANTARDLIQWLNLNPKTGVHFERWRHQKNRGN